MRGCRWLKVEVEIERFLKVRNIDVHTVQLFIAFLNLSAAWYNWRGRFAIVGPIIYLIIVTASASFPQFGCISGATLLILMNPDGEYNEIVNVFQFTTKVNYTEWSFLFDTNVKQAAQLLPSSLQHGYNEIVNCAVTLR